MSSPDISRVCKFLESGNAQEIEQLLDLVEKLQATILRQREIIQQLSR